MDENNFDTILHSPVGTRDIYGLKCAQKISLQDKIHKVFLSYGFTDIQTPTFEYFDVFGKEKGTVSSRQMFKFFDRDNNTLVLRPDITPSIARCISKYYSDEKFQIRKCYIGNTFTNVQNYKGKLEEVTQAGAELYNDDTSDADAEMVGLTSECLLECGLKDFQIEVGHAGFFKGLFDAANLKKEDAMALRTLIETKNFFGVEDLLNKLNVSDDLKSIFVRLSEFQDDFEDAAAFVEKHTDNKDVLDSIDRLRKVNALLEEYEVSDHVTIDLSMLSTYDYYTGIIFKAYTHGNGEALSSGGRYDNLVSQFGKEANAIGLVISVDELLIAMRRQNLDFGVEMTETLLLYDRADTKKAIEEAKKLRKAGKRVQLVRKSSKYSEDEYKEYAKRNEIEEFIYLR